MRLVHTADWHLGKRFPAFTEEDARTLSRARLEVVGRILDLAVRYRADAVLAVGDLFDDPNPPEPFWRGLLEVLDRPGPPVILVPGNHDPLTAESVWARRHPFRVRLPARCHVVDDDDFALELGAGVVLSRPCRSRAGEMDLALALPPRADGDTRLRIGAVHGSTFDMPGYQMNFPIARDAGSRRGLDYLAIGDTHAFRDVTPDGPVPTVYPGAPEPTSFGETDAGYVAVVALYRRGMRPRVFRERVGRWTWRQVRCERLSDLRDLLLSTDLEQCVLRLVLDLEVSVAEEAEVERILAALRGTSAAHGRVGVLTVDRSGLRLASGAAEVFSDDLPEVLRDTVERLERQAEEAPTEAERARAVRAMALLYRSLARHDGAA